METENLPAKNITEIWINNISEGLLLMERYEKSFRSGVETLAELADLFLLISWPALWKKSFRETSLKVTQMFVSQAEVTLADCWGFIPAKEFEQLEKDIREYTFWLHTDNYLYYYAPSVDEPTYSSENVLQFRPEWKQFIQLLVALRLRFVKILSPILFTNLNSAKKNLEI